MLPIALWLYLVSRFCTRSLLRETLDYSIIDKIPGRQNDRKTLLGELNWIFTAVTDTIAWNVLPHGNFLNKMIYVTLLSNGSSVALFGHFSKCLVLLCRSLSETV